MFPALPPVLHAADTDSGIKHFPPTCARKYENIGLKKKKKSVIIRIKNTNLPRCVAGSARLLQGPNGSEPPVPCSGPSGGKTLLIPKSGAREVYISPPSVCYTQQPPIYYQIKEIHVCFDHKQAS